MIYDISENKPRSELAKLLKEFGLTRVQYSGFMGELNPNDRKVLENIVKRFVKTERDSIYIVPLCSRCLATLKIVGKGKKEDEEGVIIR